MKKISKIFIPAIVIIAYPILSFGDQIGRDIDFILSHYNTDTLKAEAIQTRPTTSAVGLTAVGAIKIYQTVISSQDGPACNFTPSCSRFTAQAIREGGILKGALLGADRLMRCHWFSKSHYRDYYKITRVGKSTRLYDPVQRYLDAEYKW